MENAAAWLIRTLSPSPKGIRLALTPFRADIFLQSHTPSPFLFIIHKANATRNQLQRNLQLHKGKAAVL